LANSYLQVGEIYANLKQYDKALEYLRPGLKISTEIGAKAFIMNTYSALYSIMIARKKDAPPTTFEMIQQRMKQNSEKVKEILIKTIEKIANSKSFLTLSNFYSL